MRSGIKSNRIAFLPAMGHAMMIQRLFNTETQPGLLALAPFFLVASSLYAGFSTGLIIAALLPVLALIIYFLRNLIPSQQRLAAMLIISTTVVLITRMFLNAEAYAIADKIGIFLPLLLMNSLVLSINERMFSIQGFKSVMRYIFSIGIAILLFFTIFGFLRELFDGFSILTSSAGCFFLSGLLFATINFCKNDNPIFKQEPNYLE